MREGDWTLHSRIRRHGHTGSKKRHKCQFCGTVRYEVYMRKSGTKNMGNQKPNWSCAPTCHKDNGFKNSHW